LVGPAAEARKAAQQFSKDDQGPEAQAKRKTFEEVQAKVDALAKQKSDLLKSVRYNEGSKVHIAAFGEVEGSKRATGITGPVATGCGSNAAKIGPEYGFGMALESKLDSPVLLIKVSWGGIDIDGGFRPPSSTNVGNEANPPAAPGPKYQELVKQVHAVLADLKTYHPDYDPAAGYEMAGFYWFPGFNDQFGDKPTRYKEHMANFIRDIRSEFEAPVMPFVIGVIGTASMAKNTDYSALSHAAAVELGKTQMAEQPVAVAQREAAALPEFAGTVVAVESYPYYDYAIVPIYNEWKNRFSEWQNAGSDRPYHYLGSARFFTRFGHACGEAMIGLQKKP
jgi:alpha-galactosidase